MDQTFEKRKKVIFDFICDDLYVPMKIREIAAVLQIPREQRDELKAVLDALVRKVQPGAGGASERSIPGKCPRLRLRFLRERRR